MTAALKADSAFTATRLERVFAHCFAASERTTLEGGAAEPVYEPAATPGSMSCIHYREDYFASALHEVAHWCIAGAERRRLRDFGYWYAPDGRDAAAQRAFESVEDKPQALEWLFSLACAYPFQVSIDNLDPKSGALPDTRQFCERVLARALDWQSRGPPARAEIFFTALAREFGTGLTLDVLRLRLADLR